MKNPTNNPRTLFQLDISSSSSVKDFAKYGPSFGSYIDLYIASRANEHSHSHERLGHTYTVPSGKTNDPFLTGDRNGFRVNEIELFYETAQ